MKIKNLIIVVLATLLFASCGSEFRLAKQFVSQTDQVQVAVYFPEEAQVTLVQAADGSYSQVLDSISQDLFLDVMYAAYAEELGRYNLTVYIPDDPDAVQVDSTHWLVLLSRVELQGLFTEYVDELYDLRDTYSYSFALNTVNVASWFDVNDGDWHPTLFDEYNLTDEFSSYVTNSREGAQYHYNITPLKHEDVYNFAVFLGRRYAAFTYDYMMNRYVASELEVRQMAPRFRISWDPRAKAFSFQMEGEGFIVVEEN